MELRSLTLLLVLTLATITPSEQTVITPVGANVAFHVVYVHYFDASVRDMNKGNALSISTDTMQDEVKGVLELYKGGHEIIAVLTAVATKSTKMYTNIPDSNMEIETFIFLFTTQDKLLLPYVHLVARPPSEETVSPSATPELPQLTNPSQRRKQHNVHDTVIE